LSSAALPLEGGPCRNVTANVSLTESAQTVVLHELISFSEYQITIFGLLDGFARTVSTYVNTRTRKFQLPNESIQTDIIQIAIFSSRKRHRVDRDP
jgi:hypothetical protein